jgi:uncharacterized protein (DUF4415 family)
MVKVGQGPSQPQPPKEIIKAAKKAARKPIRFTEDCPDSTPEALKEFAFLAMERNKAKKKLAVTIKVVPDCLAKYKALGKGYTGIMADVLNYVANNPEILSRIT